MIGGRPTRTSPTAGEEAILASVFPQGTRIRGRCIGSMKDLSGRGASARYLSSFFAEFYHPPGNLAPLAGDFDPPRPSNSSPIFRPLAAGPSPPADRRPPAVKPEARKIAQASKVQLPRVTGPAHRGLTPTRSARRSTLLAEILAGEASRLPQGASSRGPRIAMTCPCLSDTNKVAGLSSSSTPRPRLRPPNGDAKSRPSSTEIEAVRKEARNGAAELSRALRSTSPHHRRDDPPPLEGRDPAPAWRRTTTRLLPRDYARYFKVLPTRPPLRRCPTKYLRPRRPACTRAGSSPGQKQDEAVQAGQIEDRDGTRRSPHGSPRGRGLAKLPGLPSPSPSSRRRFAKEGLSNGCASVLSRGNPALGERPAPDPRRHPADDPECKAGPGSITSTMLARAPNRRPPPSWPRR